MCHYAAHIAGDRGISTPEEVVIPERLRHLARLRRVRDRLDREYAEPLDVDALARDAHLPARHLSREFSLAYGESPYRFLVTRRVERDGTAAAGGHGACEALAPIDRDSRSTAPQPQLAC